MRDLNEVEMEIVAGGLANGGVVLKTAQSAVALAPGKTKTSNLSKISSHAAANLSGDGSMHPSEIDASGGDTGGDGGGGGGDDGDTGGDGGDTGDTGDAGDTGDTGDTSWVSEQGDPPTGDQLTQDLSNNKDISSTCKGTSGGGAQCVVGTADQFVVTTTDSHGNILSQISCTKDSSWTLQAAVNFVTKLFGGATIGGGVQGGYKCVPVTK